MLASRISAYIFLVLITGVFILSVLTLSLKADKLSVPGESADDIIKGRTTAAFEKKYGEHLWGRDAVVTPWNTVSYGIFRSADRKIMIGEEGWVYFREEVALQTDEKKETEHKLRIIEQVRDYLASRNIALVVALLPSKARIYPEYLQGGSFPSYKKDVYDSFRTDLLQRGIVTPDLLRLFEEKKPNVPMFLKTDTHWTPRGAALTAQAVAKAVAVQCTGFTWEEQPYRTFITTPESYDGDLLKFIQTGFMRPFIGPEGERIAREKTVLDETPAAGGELDLFGEQEIGITLVGTSFSFMQHLNFEGALKTAFKTDVLNLATEGQGPMQPMAEYLEKTDLSHNPPQLVIWEIPERFIPIAYPDASFDFLTAKQKTGGNESDGPQCHARGEEF